MEILLSGAVTFNGQDIGYKISKTEKNKILIDISFIRGSKNETASFTFNKDERDNMWSLDRTLTESEVDMYFEYNEKNKNISLFMHDPLKNDVIGLYLTDNSLAILKNKKYVIDLLEAKSANIANKKIDINLDNISKYSTKLNVVQKVLLGKIIRTSIKDLEKTVFKKNSLQICTKKEQIELAKISQTLKQNKINKVQSIQLAR